MRSAYNLFLLWLLSYIGRGAVEVIYECGHDDGAAYARDVMRGELHAVASAQEKQRAHDFANGFAAGLRAAQHDDVDALVARSEGRAWAAPEGKRRS